MVVERKGVQSIAAATLIVALGFLNGCSTAGEESEPEVSATDTPGCGGDEDACYIPYDFAFYCMIQEARVLMEEGEMSASDLPDWSVQGELDDGTPRIYDFRDRSADNRSGNALALQLQDSIREATGDGVSWSKISDCEEALSAEEIAEREGGWPSAPGGRE